MHINIILEGPIFPFLLQLATKNSYRIATSKLQTPSFKWKLTFRYSRVANFRVRELRIFREEDALERVNRQEVKACVHEETLVVGFSFPSTSIFEEEV